MRPTAGGKPSARETRSHIASVHAEDTAGKRRHHRGERLPEAADSAWETRFAADVSTHRRHRFPRGRHGNSMQETTLRSWAGCAPLWNTNPRTERSLMKANGQRKVVWEWDSLARVPLGSDDKGLLPADTGVADLPVGVTAEFPKVRARLIMPQDEHGRVAPAERVHDVHYMLLSIASL